MCDSADMTLTNTKCITVSVNLFGTQLINPWAFVELVNNKLEFHCYSNNAMLLAYC